MSNPPNIPTGPDIDPETGEIIVQSEGMSEADFIDTVDNALKDRMAKATREANVRSGMYYAWEKTVPSVTLRILPAPRSANTNGLPFVAAIQHWFNQDGKRMPFPCFAQSGHGCVFCDYANEVAKFLPKKEADDYQAQTRFLYNVIDINDAYNDNGYYKVKVYGAPKGVHASILEAMNQGWKILARDGFPMAFTRTVQNSNTRYSGVPTPNNFVLELPRLPALHNLRELASPPLTVESAMAIIAQDRAAIAVRGAGGGGGVGAGGVARQALPPMARQVSASRLAEANANLGPGGVKR